MVCVLNLICQSHKICLKFSTKLRNYISNTFTIVLFINIIKNCVPQKNKYNCDRGSYFHLKTT